VGSPRGEKGVGPYACGSYVDMCFNCQHKPIGNGLVKSVTDQCPMINELLKSVTDPCRIGNGLQSPLPIISYWRCMLVKCVSFAGDPIGCVLCLRTRLH
jgi:hypothetical protein